MTAEEIHALVERYAAGKITAEDYFAACEVYAHEMVEQELRDMATRRRSER